MNRIPTRLLGVVILLTVGCQSKPTPRSPTPDARPPAVPPRANVAVDRKLRDNAMEEIARGFASPDPVLRANAVEATQRGLGVGGRDLLLAALSDGDPLVRFSAAMAAGTLRMESAREQLEGMVDDTNLRVQIGTRFALHRLGDTRRSHDFESYARDPSPGVRGDTVLALGLLGEPSAVKILRALRKDQSPLVRLQVVEALYRLGDEGARGELLAGTISNYADDQIVCILALPKPPARDRTIETILRGKLTNDYPEVSLAAARALGTLGLDDGTGVAIKGATAKDPRQRALAALALGAIGRTDTQPQLQKLLGDANPSVRLSAAAAVLQLAKV
ncbi:MAG TPA: HEAT repeat domain-containing protein [Tepidisphaeraceae bacterium]|jgi:HEAT repeat protein